MDKKQIIPYEEMEQLSLRLNIDEAEVAASEDITPAEAERISLQAKAALEAYQEKILAFKPQFDAEGCLNQTTAALPFWLDDYFTLRDQGWKWRVAALIAWAASPRKTRWPKTQMDLAKLVMGLNSDRMIVTWRKKNPAIDEAIALMQAMPLLKHRGDVMTALADSASTADYKNHPDRKLFLEMTGDYQPKTKVDIGRSMDPDDLSELSDEQLKELKKKLGNGSN